MKPIEIAKGHMLMIALFLLSRYVNAYPTGAPTAACQNMTPNHGVNAQTSGNIYRVSIEPTSYTAGTVVTVTLDSATRIPFKGFLLEVKTDNNEIVSGFSAGDNGKLLDCNSQSNAAVTHKDDAAKVMVKFNWTAPSNLEGDLEVFATVVQTKVMYWTMIKADLLNGGTVMVFNVLEMFAVFVLLQITL